MKRIIVKKVCLVFMLTLKTTGLQAQTQITLEKVVNEWGFHSPSAEKIRLTYDNISMTRKNI